MTKAASPTAIIVPITAQTVGELACAPPEYFLSMLILKAIISVSGKTSNISPKITINPYEKIVCNQATIPYATTSF